MAVKLDLKKTVAKEGQQEKAEASNPSASASSRKIPPKATRSQGRPKGTPAVTRSLRIRTDVNDRLVKEQARTGLSYNELANRAFDAYLK